MNVLIPLAAGLVLFVIATRTYPFYLSRLLGVDDSRPTPAKRINDGRDYVPTRTQVVFGHHFAAIAGAGPIVGPVMALAFGYGPAWLWIVFGAILFGAVHDMTSMYVSMREEGKTMAELSRRTLGPAGYLFFVVFLILILTLINAIFLNLSATALTSAYPLQQLQLEPTTKLLRVFERDGVLMGKIGGIATTSVLIITVFAPVMGWLVHKKKWPMPPVYAIAAVVCVVSILIGFRLPIAFTAAQWRWVMSGYVFVACWIPVWMVMQPRDFVNVQILYGGFLVMTVGLVIFGLGGHSLQAPATAFAEGSQRLGGPIWPLLMITVACGAISGFHSLAASGTTVKQISSEQDVRRIGYNGMILEGGLALLVLMLVGSALPSSEYYGIVYDQKNPILGFAMAMGYMLHNTVGLQVAIGSVVGILVIEGFVVTTLDTAVRLCRYLLEEFWVFVFAGNPPRAVKSALFNTLLAVALMLFFALNSTIYSAWRAFGAGNQLIAALAMTVVTVWLLQRGRSFWFTIVPAVIMTATTFAMLTLEIRKFVVGGTGLTPLLVADALMLVLAVGVVFVSVSRFLKAWPNRRERRDVLPVAADASGGS